MPYPNNLELKFYPHPVLTMVASKVIDFNSDLGGFCNKMLAFMAEKNGLGLAAPQVGVSKRIFVTHQKPWVWINPVIVSSKADSFLLEGCLSFPDLFYKILRSRKIIVEYQDVQGNKHSKSLDAKKGALSVVVQHELDHLNGILFVDRKKDAHS